MSTEKFSVTEKVDGDSSFAYFTQYNIGTIHAYALDDSVILRLGAPGDGSVTVIGLSPQGWETVIDAVTQVLNAMAVDVPGA